jgi:hypothetical protein
MTEKELEKEIEKRLEKLMKSRDFEKVVKKIISDCFVEFNRVMWANRYFLKNQIG